MADSTVEDTTGRGRPLPWTIRGVPTEVRHMAIEAAKREDVTLGKWLDDAISSYIEGEEARLLADGQSAVPQLEFPEDIEWALRTALSFAERIAGLSKATPPAEITKRLWELLQQGMAPPEGRFPAAGMAADPQSDTRRH